jgi:predicted Rossmann fold nucleotide-binding protein DprA/Smf involved in DNA uptake
VLVLSIFHPKAGWGKELAMARNPIIYGLASEIYVAESKPSKNRQGKETKGGTYAGVVDGLKKGRKIYVRQPDDSEKNDNKFLIQNGAVAVDFDGKIIETQTYKQKQLPILNVAEPTIQYYSFADRVKELLSKGGLTIHGIHKKLEYDKSEQKLTKELKQLDFIEIRKEKNKNHFFLRNNNKSIFDLENNKI